MPKCLRGRVEQYLGRWSFQSVVEVAGLVVWTTYHYRLVVEDDMGFIAEVQGSFMTEALPKLAINEVVILL